MVPVIARWKDCCEPRVKFEERLPLMRANSIATAIAVLTTLIAIAVVAAAHWLPAGRLAEKSDILTAFSGHVVIVAAAVLTALGFRRSAALILTFGVVAAVVAHVALARVKQAQGLWPLTQVTASRDHLRVYELNVWDHNPDIPRLERALASIDADVVVLAESDPSKVAMIERLKARFPYQVSCAARHECAMAILSRYPIIEGRGVRANLTSPPIVWARIDARAARVGEVTVIGTHVHRPTRNAWLHAMQMQSLAAIVSTAKTPVILAGDLNTGSWSAAYARLMRVTGLVPTAGLQPTWPAYPIDVPQVALDHILVSPDLIAVRSGLGPPTGSDHLPVYAEITRRTVSAVHSR